MYLFITQNAQEKIKQFNLHDEIKQLRRKIENAQNLQEVRGSFEPLYPYLKRRIGKLYRLIAKPLSYDSNEVLFYYQSNLAFFCNKLWSLKFGNWTLFGILLWRIY